MKNLTKSIFLFIFPKQMNFEIEFKDITKSMFLLIFSKQMNFEIEFKGKLWSSDLLPVIGSQNCSPESLRSQCNRLSDRYTEKKHQKFESK
jgi:hypothetical protein